MKALNLSALAISLLVLLHCSQVASNVAIELPLDERVARAELVAVGRIVSLDESRRVAIVRPTLVLKGQSSDFEFGYEPGYDESVMHCCVVGGEYFFMVSRDKVGVFRTKNAQYEVYPIALESSNSKK